MFVFVCLRVPKDLANCRTDMVLLYSENSLLGEITITLPREKKTTLQKKYLKLKIGDFLHSHSLQVASRRIAISAIVYYVARFCVCPFRSR